MCPKIDVITLLIVNIQIVFGCSPELLLTFERQRPDTQNGGEVWTVMYRSDQGTKPRLRMINSFGDGWNTQKQCDTIVQRLEGFRQNGLIGLSALTPKQPINPQSVPTASLTAIIAICW